VHGCFWHSHADCALASVPTVRPEYWLRKLELNRLRDKRTLDVLQQQGWRVLIVWECETRNESTLAQRLTRFLSDDPECRVRPQEKRKS
jgi:DNA mismatch endonuclease (patch repair protein)